MDNVIGIALATVAIIGLTFVFKCSIIALSVWLAATCPEETKRIYTVYRERPWRCFLIGCVNTFAFVLFGLVLGQEGPLALLGLLLIFAVALFHLWGRTATYRRMAEKLELDGAGPGAPKTLAVGGLVTELIFLVPVFGQILYLGTTMRAMGAVVVALLPRRKETIPEVPPEIDS